MIQNAWREKRFCRVVDPRDLEQYSRKRLDKRSADPDRSRKRDLLIRAFQAIPPKELQMLYALKVGRSKQSDVMSVHHVRQPNVSYRMKRGMERIKLHVEFAATCSETTLRRALIKAGCKDLTIRVVLGVAKTTCQSAVGSSLGIAQSSVRNMVVAAVERLEESPGSPDRTAALALMTLVTKNYNRLRSPKAHVRWKNRRGAASVGG